MRGSKADTASRVGGASEGVAGWERSSMSGAEDAHKQGAVQQLMRPTNAGEELITGPKIMKCV